MTKALSQTSAQQRLVENKRAITILVWENSSRQATFSCDTCNHIWDAKGHAVTKYKNPSGCPHCAVYSPKTPRTRKASEQRIATRVRRILQTMEEQSCSFQYALDTVAEQDGVTAGNVRTTWDKRATKSEKKQRERLDPRNAHRRTIIEGVLTQAESGTHKSYNQCCVAASEELGVSYINVRNMFEIHATTGTCTSDWDRLCAVFPEPIKEIRSAL